MAVTEAPPTTTTEAPVWHTLAQEVVAQELDVEPGRGLTSEEAASRLARYGPNRFAEAKTESRWHAFLRQYEDPMQIVLLVAGVISIYPVKQTGTGIVILLLTLFNAALGLQQEGKAAAAVAALAKMMIVKARVRRDGALTQLPAEQLVPGDIVAIEAGDVVPADGRVLAAATLEVAEAALTGESLPVGKGVEAVAAADAPLGDRTDMVYMNTNVTRGTGEFIVTSTAMATEVGHISGMLQGQDESKSPLTVQLEKLTKQLVMIAALGAGRLHRAQHGARAELHGGLHRCGGVRDRRDPDGASRGRDDDPVARHAAAGRRERDHQAAALDGDAGCDLGDLLRQDGHADAQPDDRGGADDPGAALRDLGQRLFDGGSRQARRGRAGGCTRAVHVPAGAGLRRRAHLHRGDDRRPHRGRAGGAGGEGRRRPRRDARALPTGRRAPVRHGVQADGHVPPDDR